MKTVMWNADHWEEIDNRNPLEVCDEIFGEEELEPTYDDLMEIEDGS